jgi:hypothetical protein
MTRIRRKIDPVEIVHDVSSTAKVVRQHELANEIIARKGIFDNSVTFCNVRINRSGISTHA